VPDGVCIWLAQLHEVAAAHVSHSGCGSPATRRRDRSRRFSVISPLARADQRALPGRGRPSSRATLRPRAKRKAPVRAAPTRRVPESGGRDRSLLGPRTSAAGARVLQNPGPAMNDDDAGQA